MAITRISDCSHRAATAAKGALALTCISLIALAIFQAYPLVSQETMNSIQEYGIYAAGGYLGLSLVYILLGLRKPRPSNSVCTKDSRIKALNSVGSKDSRIKVLLAIRDELNRGGLTEDRKIILAKKCNRILRVFSEAEFDETIEVKQVLQAFIDCNQDPIVNVLNNIKQKLEDSTTENPIWRIDYKVMYATFQLITKTEKAETALRQQVLKLFIDKKPPLLSLAT